MTTEKGKQVIAEAFAQLFRNSSHAQAIISAKGELVESNASWLKMWAISIEKSSTKPFAQSNKRFAESPVPEIIEECCSVKSEQVQEFWYTCPKGNVIYLKVKVSPIFSDKEELLYSLLVCEDHTENKISTDRFKRFSELTTEGIVIHKSGVILETNPAMLKIVGLEKFKNIIGKTVFDYIPESQHATVKGYLSNPEITEYESLVKKVDGSVIPVKVWVRKYHFDKEESRVAIIKDISQEKASAELLENTMERLALALEVEKIGHFYWNLQQGETVQWDRTMHEIFELNPKSGQDKLEYFTNRIHPQDREIVSERFRESLSNSSDQQKFSNEFRIVNSRGETRFLEFVSRHYRNQQNEVIRLVGSCRDITSRVVEKTRRKESEERFRQMANLLPIALFESDLSATITYANRAAFELFEFEEKDLNLNINGLDLFYGEHKEKAKYLLSRNLKGAGAGTTKFRIATKQGRIIPVLMYFSPIEENGMAIGVRGVIVDISQQEKFELNAIKQNKKLSEAAQDLQQSNLKLKTALEKAQRSDELQKALNKLKSAQTQLIESEKLASIGILTAGVAHEVNNPLNFIQGGAMALKVELEELSPNNLGELLEFLEMIQNGVQRASNIINSLNRFNRKGDQMNEPCYVNEIIDNCLVILNNKLKHKISLEKNYCSGECTVIGNEGKLHQVFMNILANAEQAIIDSGTITIETHTYETEILTIISDNGGGIAPENLKKVTEPFFTTKPPGLGTGLGLSLCHNIIREHGGKLNIESELQKGTKITISLPRTV